MGDASACWWCSEDVQLVIDWWQCASLPVQREGLFADMPALQVATLMEAGVGINDSGIWPFDFMSSVHGMFCECRVHGAGCSHGQNVCFKLLEIFIRLVRKLIHWAWIHPTTTGLYRSTVCQKWCKVAHSKICQVHIRGRGTSKILSCLISPWSEKHLESKLEGVN